MKPTAHIRRRDFLQAAGGGGVIGLLCGSSRGSAAGGDPPATASRPALTPRFLAQLAGIAKEYVTIPKEEGQFLNLLVKLLGAQRVLELGTAHGYTTLWLAQALAETGGRLTTLEIVPERAELAKKHVAEAGLTARVDFQLGDAHALVPKLPDAFDLAYLDADKGGNLDYFRKLFPGRLRPGGLLIAHNAVLLADKMKDYLDALRDHPEFETVLVRAVPEDALALSYRRRAGA